MSVQSVRKIATSALLQVAADPEAPASARSQAARSLLELIGDLGAKASPLKDREAADLTQLTPDELAAELAALDVEEPVPGRKRNRS